MCPNVSVVQRSSDSGVTVQESNGSVNRSAGTGSRVEREGGRSAVFVDLDRTLLRGASGPVIDAALRAEGLLEGRPRLPAGHLLYGFYDLFGETLPMMALVRGAAQFVSGWSEADFRRAGERAAPILLEMVQPFARGVLEEHRQRRSLLVLGDDHTGRPGHPARRGPRLRRRGRDPLCAVRRNAFAEG